MDNRCSECGHWLSEHGPGGCAADDEAAMNGCFCEVTQSDDGAWEFAPFGPF